MSNVSSGFFNSVGGSPKYDANDISSMFDGVLVDGIFKDFHPGNSSSTATGFLPKNNASGHLVIGSGRCWFKSIWLYNDGDYEPVFAAGSASNPRIDTVVIEIDKNPGVRNGSIKVIQGTPAANPVAPTLVNTTLKRQYPLVDVYIPTGRTTTYATITDVRTDHRGSTTPWSSSLVSGVSETDIISIATAHSPEILAGCTTVLGDSHPTGLDWELPLNQDCATFDYMDVYWHDRQKEGSTTPINYGVLRVIPTHSTYHVIQSFQSIGTDMYMRFGTLYVNYDGSDIWIQTSYEYTGSGITGTQLSGDQYFYIDKAVGISLSHSSGGLGLTYSPASPWPPV